VWIKIGKFEYIFEDFRGMQDDFRHKGLRKKLVQSLREQGIESKAVLEAIERVPRHLFLDKAFTEIAYENRAFPIGKGQTISHPFTVAYQTQLLELKPGMTVLEIGTGSGYQAAVLSEMGVKVYSLERIQYLHEKTQKLLKGIGYTKIRCFHGDGFAGLPELAPYDRILITAAAPEIPQGLLAQMAVGGMMVIPLGEMNVQKMLRIIRQDAHSFQQETFADFSFVPMLRGMEQG
jgi:protein-L-isoaspartate(D-aspartate) O-methyltransferase